MLWCKKLFREIDRFLFDPSEVKSFYWLIYTPALLLFACAAFLLKSFPPGAVLLFLGVFSLAVFWFAPKRWSSLAVTALFLTYGSFCLLSPDMGDLWSRMWGFSVFCSFWIGYQVFPGAKMALQEIHKRLKEEGNEKNLWKNRFDTLKERQKEDLQVIEEEVDKSKRDLEDQKNHLRSLRKLLEISQMESATFSKEKRELLKEKESLKAEIQNANKAVVEESVEVSVGDEKEPLFSKEEIFSLISETPSLQENIDQRNQIIDEIRELLGEEKRPFKWQEWRGERGNKKKPQIHLSDLAKSLKN